MSVVSGITLICSLTDADELGIHKTLNELLNKYEVRGVFREMSEDYGGPKHPQCSVFGAGVTSFDHEPDFAATVMNLPWEYPENVALIMQPEEGPTKVFRPKGVGSR